MLHSNLPEPQLLKVLLEPLLEDFQYWFTRSRSLLQTEVIPFLTVAEQQTLLERVETALNDVIATQSLFRATDGQVGVDTQVLMQWHTLLMECWQVAHHYRLSKSCDA
ncbi:MULTISPECIES: DUF2605 domain-containing protein [unclassified Thermosynechococcus]|uniref:DUF2605 domain-containing protein n=1 Tax=unclassified Thermosynechococcus TaxID=2622553 RepID=UPI0019F56481|nr:MULTISPECIES: DUF2605 domain-containing protein [unclassified Thermosynechococcus]HIK34756.1 DUF2605 domain-containing protein [Thermosynechococcus sp. M98_K2018_005]HIK49143.1 DUF2605 domain-containing protein [Thermosynechococcus sp. M55_K2018_012]